MRKVWQRHINERKETMMNQDETYTEEHLQTHWGELVSTNEHLRDMLRTAKERGFSPEFMMFDSWYSSNETLGLLQKWKWNYMVGIKSNRVFNGYMAGFQRVSIPLLKRAVEEHKMTCFSNLLRSCYPGFLEIMLLCLRKPR